MGKNWKYLIAVIVVALVALWILKSKNQSTLSDNLSVKASAVEQWDEIIISKGDEVLQLSKVKDAWLVGNGLSANRTKVNLLADVFSNLSVRYPYTGSKGEALKARIQQEGMHLSALTGKNQAYQAYILFDTEKNEVFAYMPGNQYVVSVYAAEKSSIHSGLLSTEVEYWRDNTLVSLEKEDIKSLKLNWTDDDASFSIEQTSNGELSFHKKDDGTCEFDPSTVKFYLYEFKHLEYSQKLKQVVENRGNMLCEMLIHTHSGNHYKIIFAEMMNNGEVSKSELLVGLPDLNEWGTVTYIKANPVLRKASFFVKKR